MSRDDENKNLPEDMADAAEGTSPDEGYVDEGSSIFTAPSQQKPAKTHKNSRVLKLVAAVLALALLVACAVVLALVFKDDAEEEPVSSSDSSSISLMSVSTGDISKIEIKNGLGEYTISAAEETSDSSGDDSADWVLEGVDERIPLDEDLIYDAVDALAVIDAKRELGSAAGLSDYGLDNPEITARVTMKSGEEYTVSIGAKTAVGSGRYLYVTGLDSVYLADSEYGDILEEPVTYFADLVLVKAIDEDSYAEYFSSGELIGFDKIELSGSMYPQGMELAYLPDDALLAYQVLSPVKDYGNEVTMTNILSPFSSSLYAADTYAFSPDAATLSETGFDAPLSSVKYTLGDIDLTVTLGKSDGDGNYYVMVNDIPAIYKIAETSADFALYTPDEIYFRSIFVEALDDISSLRFEADGMDYKFDIENKTTTTVNEDGETETKDETIVRLDGREISSSDFKNFYQRLLMMQSVESMPSDVPDAAPECRITFEHVDSSVDDTVIEFTKYSSRRYIAQKVGGRSMFIKSETVNEFITYAQNLVNGEEVPTP